MSEAQIGLAILAVGVAVLLVFGITELQARLEYRRREAAKRRHPSSRERSPLAAQVDALPVIHAWVCPDCGDIGLARTVDEREREGVVLQSLGSSCGPAAAASVA